MDPKLVYMLAFTFVLLVILVVSFSSRARVFSQYLKMMTGIRLKPSEIREVFRLRGKPGVRELFLDLIIREDLKDSPPITPDTPASRPATELIDR
ncbi:MAG TPA: hypothetical protein PK014_12990 [Thermoanaerobaculia bacterium]|nr:hypothetical protein [Thermoanaerobaculia bacterium]HUM31015.1 hypothetical protein [Thermoanaerobaculia bacterium]HXK69313.1 hypothetical protein [Thermoanaerobaculia bacterium]